jgi:hypothetical protein
VSDLANLYQIDLGFEKILRLWQSAQPLSSSHRVLLYSIISRCFCLLTIENQEQLVRRFCLEQLRHEDLVLIQKIIIRLSDKAGNLIRQLMSYLFSHYNTFGPKVFTVLTAPDASEQSKRELLGYLLRWSADRQNTLSWESAMLGLWQGPKVLPFITSMLLDELLAVATTPSLDAFCFAFPRSNVNLNATQVDAVWLHLDSRPFLRKFLGAVRLRNPSGFDPSGLDAVARRLQSLACRELPTEFVDLLEELIWIEGRAMGLVIKKQLTDDFSSLNVPAFHALLNLYLRAQYTEVVEEAKRALCRFLVRVNSSFEGFIHTVTLLASLAQSVQQRIREFELLCAHIELFSLGLVEAEDYGYRSTKRQSKKGRIQLEIVAEGQYFKLFVLPSTTIAQFRTRIAVRLSADQDMLHLWFGG